MAAKASPKPAKVAAAKAADSAFPATAALQKALKATLDLPDLSLRGLARSSGVDDASIRKTAKGERGMTEGNWLKLAAASPVGSPLRALLAKHTLPSLSASEANAVRPAGDDGRTTVPFSAIVCGPNYRTTLAEEDLEGLAQSILAKGILQNVLVRPLKDGKVELWAGQRRYRAVELLIKRGDAKPDFPVPVLIREMEGDEALALSIVENIQKVDVHPVEEAEGFRQLRDAFGWSTKRIAEALGGKERLRYVQQRLNIVDKLSPTTREAFHDSRINLDQARALWALPRGLQDHLLKDKQLPDYSADAIRRTARSLCVSSKHAIFDPADYKGESFADGKETLYVDVKQFAKLQDAAIKKRIAELKAKWADVKIVQGHWIDTTGYQSTKDRKKGIAFVLVREPFHRCGWHSIEVREGYVKAAPASAKGGAAGEKPAPGLSKRTLTEAHHLKTIELQRAVAAADATVSMALTIIALLPAEYSSCESVQIRRQIRQGNGASLSSYNTPAEHHLAKLLTAYVEAGLVVIERDEERIIRIGARPSRRADLFRALIADRQIDAIFAAVVARDTGSFPGYEPRYGDDPLVVAVAEATGATLDGKWKMTGFYLDPFRKDQMQAVARACIGDFEVTPSTKKSDAAISIRAHPNRNEAWLPPELHFGTGAEIAGAVSAMLGVRIEAPETEEEDDDGGSFDADSEEDVAEAIREINEEVGAEEEPEEDGDDTFAGDDEEAA